MSAPNLTAQILLILLAMPKGASISQLCEKTGATRKCVADSTAWMIECGKAFGVRQQKSSRYFATAAQLEAARSSVAADWIAETEMYAERRRARQKKFRTPEYMARLSAKTKAQRAVTRAERGLPPIGSPKPRPPKPRRPPKPPIAKAPKFKRLSIKGSPATTEKPAGWDAAAPRITADTIVTIYVPTTWRRAEVIPAHDYGPSCAEQHAQRMAAINARGASTTAVDVRELEFAP